MTWFPFVLCVLAAGTLVDFWLDYWLGDDAALHRARLEARTDWLARKVTKLASCRFCLSFHAAWMIVLVVRCGGPDGLSLVTILALFRSVRVVHAVSGAFRPDEEPDEDDQEPETRTFPGGAITPVFGSWLNYKPEESKGGATDADIDDTVGEVSCVLGYPSGGKSPAAMIFEDVRHPKADELAKFMGEPETAAHVAMAARIAELPAGPGFACNNETPSTRET